MYFSATKKVLRIDAPFQLENGTALPNIEITYHIFKRNNQYQIKKTYWFEMFSEYDGDLKPQLNEGITKVKWIGPKKLKKVKKNIYANIESLI